MKVCLINPPFTKNFCRGPRWQAASKGTALWMPIWLIYATGVLDQNGHKTFLIDSPAKNQTRDDLVKEVSGFEPEVIVLYTSTGSIFNDIEVCNILKKHFPKAITILTGPHVSTLPEETLRKAPGADYVIMREFDYVLRDFVNHLEKKKSPNSIPGIAFLENDTFIGNTPPPPIENLDELPFSIQVIEKHLDIKDYHMDYLLFPWVQTFFGRGCYGRCTFCLWPQTLMGRKMRYRSLDSIFAELDYIRDKAPYVKELMIDDDTFTFDKKRVKEFCERKIDGGYKINWTVNVRPNLTDTVLIKLMKNAGCRAMVAGYESGSPDILKRVRKGITVDKMFSFALATRKTGIQVHGDFIIGLPGETKETIDMTYKAALRLKPATMQVSIALPLPGTEFYNWLKQNNYLKTEDFSKYLTSDGSQNVLMDYPELSSQDMQKAMRKIIIRYYLRPSYIISALWRCSKDFREIIKFWHAGLKFIKYTILGAK